MLYSITEARGDGGLIEVPTPPYLSKDHLTVYVDFIATTDFTWVTDQRIRVLVPTNKLVRVVRRTSPATRLTDYQDGTVLGGDTLDVDSIQAFYLAQEALDLAALSGSVVGSPAAGTESTTNGLLGLLTGAITQDQLSTSIVGLLGQINGSGTGSVNDRIASEALARAQAILAEQQARITALQAEAQERGAAITQEQSARQSAVDSLTSQLNTLTASVGGAVAAVQDERTARVDADAALASSVTSLTTRMGDAEADISTVATAVTDGDAALATRVDTVETSLGSVSSRVTTLEEAGTAGDTTYANYTIKAEARSDGKYSIAGIKLTSTASSSAATQSDIIFLADKLYFVPSMAGINATPQAIFTSGLVNGSAQTTFNSIVVGDKSMPARVMVDGFLEARHITAGSITADKLDTKGLTIKDQYGNVVLSAGTTIDWSKLGGAATNLSNLGYVGDLNANRTTNTNQLTDGAGLGTTATWAGVSGTGKPQDNATVGAPVGTSVGGRAVATLLTDLDDKLKKSGDSITGRITMTVADGLFAGTDLNNGVYMGSNGLVAKKAGATTFTISTDGTAQFAGALNAATGSFAGSLSAAAGTFAGALSAATGTFSGTLTADAVNAVSTVNIAGDAVIVPRRGAYYTAGAWLFSGSLTAFTLPLIQFPVAARVVLFIRWSILPANSTYSYGGFRIKANGTTIYDTGVVTAAGEAITTGGGVTVNMFTLEHAPGAGDYTYTCEFYVGGSQQTAQSYCEATLFAIKK